MSVNMKPIGTMSDYGLDGKSFRISPSMVYQFTSKKWLWYQEQVLGNSQFEGNTSTILGTIIHRIAEEFTKTKKVNKQALYDYIDTFKDRDDVDIEYIKEQFMIMGQELINYLTTFGVPDKSEKEVSFNIMENVFIAGTIDAIENDTIIDYKTTSNLTPPTKIPDSYKYQLLTYAWICKKLGMNIEKIKIVWITHNQVGRVSEKTGNPLKDYPATIATTAEVVDEDDLRFIDDYLHLVAETYLKTKENPELAYLLFADYRLKEDPNFKIRKE